MRFLVTLGIIISFSLSQAAFATDAATAVIDNATADCKSFDDGVLSVDLDKAISKVDLTGDGTPEEIIDGNFFSCSSAASLYCGTGGCGLTVIVNDKPFEFLAKAWRAGKDDDGKPVLQTAVHWSMCDYADVCWETFSWDGAAFVSQGAAVEAPTDAALPSTEWQLQNDGDKAVTIQFTDEGGFSGNGPCNDYFGSYSVSFPYLKFGQIAATSMACPNLEKESAYFKSLAGVNRIELSATALSLITRDGEVLVFHAN